MKIHLVNTARGLLVPDSDADYEAKQKLKVGEVYTAEIKLARNYGFHRKFFALINCAWEFLDEKQTNGFRTVENFRKYVEVAAGYCEPFYSPKLKRWVEIPKSIAFDKMDQAEFEDLYARVRDVIDRILSHYVSREEFERVLMSF